jgi:hypothetical protein
MAGYKTTTVSLRFPVDIVERVKAHCKRVLMRHTVFIQNATTKELFLVEKEYAESKQRKPKKDKDKNPFGPSNPTPVAPPPPPAYVDDTPRIQREMEQIFDEQAKRIAAVLDKPVEKRILVIETINKIKRTAPLSHPSEGVILSTLEEMVGALIAKAPKKMPPPPDDKEEIVDPASIDTVGDDE